MSWIYLGRFMEKPLFSWARPWSATRDKLRNSLATRVGRLWYDYEIFSARAARMRWVRDKSHKAANS